MSEQLDRVFGPPFDRPYPRCPFPEAWQRFWVKTFVYSGRASRAEYWKIQALNAGVLVALWMFGLVFHGAVWANAFFSVIMALWDLAVVLPGISLAVRRLHDANISGGWVFLLLIPFVGPVIVLILALLPSQPDGARFDAAAAVLSGLRRQPDPGVTHPYQYRQAGGFAGSAPGALQYGSVSTPNAASSGYSETPSGAPLPAGSAVAHNPFRAPSAAAAVAGAAWLIPSPVTAEHDGDTHPHAQVVAGRVLTLTLPDGTTRGIAHLAILGRDPVPRNAASGAELIQVTDQAKSVSKSHAVLEVRTDGVWVTDLGSTNGTFVGGVVIVPWVAVSVRPGVELRLGDCTIGVDRLEAP